MPVALRDCSTPDVSRIWVPHPYLAPPGFSLCAHSTDMPCMALHGAHCDMHFALGLVLFGRNGLHTLFSTQLSKPDPGGSLSCRRAFWLKIPVFASSTQPRLADSVRELWFDCCSKRLLLAAWITLWFSAKRAHGREC